MNKSVRIFVFSGFALAIFGILGVLYAKIGARRALLPAPSKVVAEYSYEANRGGLRIALKENGTYSEHRYNSVADSEQDKTEGIYTLKEGVLSLTPTHGVLPAWKGYVVTWGERAYLLKDGDFERFCKAIQKGEEPRKGGISDDFPLDASKEKTQPVGTPQFPKAWSHLLKDVRPPSSGIAPGFAYLYRTAKAALEFYGAGDLQHASRYATEALERSQYAEPGEAPLHDLNILLGAIALKTGKVQTAKAYLLEAAKAFPVRSSSPYQELMRGLWQEGEREAVLDYLEALIKKEDDPERTAGWKSGVMSGKIPALFAMDEAGSHD